jgi:hypothetical protein
MSEVTVQRRFGSAAAAIALLAAGGGSVRAADPPDAAIGPQAEKVLNAARSQVAGCGAAPSGPLPVGAPAGKAEAAAADGKTVRPQLSWHPLLAQAAARHAGAMARSRVLDHVGPDGSTVRERASVAGYRWAALGENLAAGHPTLDAAVAAWLASASHCAALLDPRFVHFGVARSESTTPGDAYRTYWALVLGRPR